ncbi:TPA: hypothetical protein DCE37_06895 [Candidatus Latescibacteria bacterium]|nr:hypothetical protein [Candidatus Latescibacterota bacterium]
MNKTQKTLLTFFAAALVVGWTCFDERLSRLGDNAEFVVLSKGLVTGHWMSFVHGPEPEPARKFPPGYPIVLAAVQLVSPDNVSLMKSLNVLFFALVVPLAWLVVREVDTELTATLVAATTLLSPHLIEFSHQVLSEVPYAALSLAALLFLLKYRHSDIPKEWIVLVVLAVSSYYIRTIGLTAIGMVVCTQFLDGRYRQGFLMGVAAAILIAPWVLSSSAYLDQFSSVNPYQTDSSPGVSIGFLFERLGRNLSKYGLVFLPTAFAPFLDFRQGVEGMGVALAVAIDLLFFYFIVMTIRHGKKEAPIGVYLALYVFVVLLWPEVWADTRFVIPIIPLAIYGIFWSVRDITARLPLNDTLKTRIPMGLAIAVLLANGLRTANTQIDHPPYHPVWRDYFEAAKWAKTATPPDAIILCRKPFLMNVMSGRTTVSYPWAVPDSVLSVIKAKSVDYVVYDQLFSSTPRYLLPTIRQHGSHFKGLHQYPQSKTTVFQFVAKPE